MSETHQEGLLSATQFAKELGISDAKVKKVIKELSLEPTAKKGICCYYSRDALAPVKAKLLP
ncbi:MAG: hypothetical protein HQM04_06005 [Magnetococcales bacterium]|nr:hypothetical protein [Magnetococcales bacterium]MBF0114580.1 hypothetical protein [Magnetococcales bacterium]